MPTAVDVFNRLRTKIGEEEAKILVEFVQETVEKGAATKEDLSLANEGLEHRIDQSKSELEHKIDQVKSELERRIDQFKSELERRIDRILYVVILLFIIFNGDKVIAFFSTLWKLAG